MFREILGRWAFVYSEVPGACKTPGMGSGFREVRLKTTNFKAGKRQETLNFKRNTEPPKGA